MGKAEIIFTEENIKTVLMDSISYVNGIISFVNACAEKAGIKAGMTVKEAVSVLRLYLKNC